MTPGRPGCRYFAFDEDAFESALEGDEQRIVRFRLAEIGKVALERDSVVVEERRRVDFENVAAATGFTLK